MKNAFVRFLNVWLCVGAVCALIGLCLGYVSVHDHAYAGKALDNVRHFTIQHTIARSQVIGGPVAISLAFLYLLIRRVSKTRKRMTRTAVILFLLSLLPFILAVWQFNNTLNSGMNKLYGQYVDLGRFAWRSILSTFNSTESFRLAAIIGSTIILMGLTFLASFIERKIFRKSDAATDERAPSNAIWLVSLAVGVALGMIAKMNEPKPAPPGSPDIIFISIDTLRADHVGCYGYSRNTTPNLDQLAREGIIVERFFSHAPWTVPSHMTMFTGMIPSRHGVTNPISSVSPKTTLFTEILKDKGYRTGGFATNILLSSSYGYEAGFDSYNVNTTWDAEAVTAKAGKWLIAGGEPTFLFLHLFDAHYPYKPKPPFLGKFRQVDKEVLEEQDEVFFTFFNWMINHGGEKRDAVVAYYDEEIAYIDAALGAFFNLLKSERRYNDAWIIVTSDHGEEFGEHGSWGHGLTLYNEMLHVPLIIKAPKGMCGTSRLSGRYLPQTALYSLITRAANPVANLQEELKCGNSGAPAFIEALTTDEPIIAEADMLGPLRYTAITRDKKLIDPISVKAIDFRFDHGYELFDMQKDFSERRNLLADISGDPMRRLVWQAAPDLQRTICRTKAQFAGKADIGKVKLDAAALEKLRSLGYINTGEDNRSHVSTDPNCVEPANDKSDDAPKP